MEEYAKFAFSMAMSTLERFEVFTIPLHFPSLGPACWCLCTFLYPRGIYGLFCVHEGARNRQTHLSLPNSHFPSMDRCLLDEVETYSTSCYRCPMFPFPRSCRTIRSKLIFWKRKCIVFCSGKGSGIAGNLEATNSFNSTKSVTISPSYIP